MGNHKYKETDSIFSVQSSRSEVSSFVGHPLPYNVQVSNGDSAKSNKFLFNVFILFSLFPSRKYLLFVELL